jgi:4-hydroxybenzoate polyprenyltransferase
MWNAYAVTLAGTTILVLLAASLIFSTRETLAGVRDLFDMRFIRRAFRNARRFRIGTLLWFTGFIALSVGVFRTFEQSPLPYLIVPFLGVMLLLTRIAIHSLFEPRIRRLPPTPNLSRLDDGPFNREDGG